MMLCHTTHPIVLRQACRTEAACEETTVGVETYFGAADSFETAGERIWSGERARFSGGRYFKLYSGQQQYDLAFHFVI